MVKIIQDINMLLAPVINSMGYELWGVEYTSSILCLYIDSRHGINIDDCEQVSKKVAPILDVNDCIQGNYSLEVSSPGLDRSLFTKQHFDTYIGNEIKLSVVNSIKGKKKFKGILKSTKVNSIIMINSSDNADYNIELDNIAKAQLV